MYIIIFNYQWIIYIFECFRKRFIFTNSDSSKKNSKFVEALKYSLCDILYKYALIAMRCNMSMNRSSNYVYIVYQNLLDHVTLTENITLIQSLYISSEWKLSCYSWVQNCLFSVDTSQSSSQLWINRLPNRIIGQLHLNRKC